MNNITIIFYWYLIIFLIGIGVFPLTSYLFSKFKDKGYGLSKVIGIALISYLFWLLNSLRLLSFQSVGLWLILVPFIAWIYLYYKKNSYLQDLTLFVKKSYKLLIIEEMLFLLSLVFWSFIRGQQPNIEGLEKYMDFGFVNSILRGDFMPPKDIWLSQYNINYYYFGHFITSLLTKISAIPSYLTYNLMLALIFAQSVSGAFCLVFNFCKFLIKKAGDRICFFAGITGAWLLNMAGNLHPVVYAFRSKAYWYPDATRYIGYNPDVEDKTIHEFPSYSHVVADLHGHMIDIPHVIVLLALIFYFFKFIYLKKDQKPYLHLIFLALMLAVSYMTNSWNLPIYLGLFGLNLSLFFLQGRNWRKNLLITVSSFLITAVFWFLFSLPYNIFFENFSKGIEATWTHSLWYQLLVLWGFFLWFLLSFVIFFIFKYRKLKKKFKNLVSAEIIFLLTLVFVSVCLIIVPEFVYLKDIYIKSYYRANTMFKLGYQAFIMLSLSSALIIAFFISQKSTAKWMKMIKLAWIVFSFALIAGVSVYPYFAIKGYYGNLKKPSSLNGWEYLQTQHPADLEAIKWFWTNTNGQPVVLEAVGDSYTKYSRISANTGLPTVLGWPVHEWLWRGSYDIPGKRTAEVKSAYESTSDQSLIEFISKYQVEYIVLGQMEKEKYPQLNEANIQAVSDLVFLSGNTKIYKVRK